MHDCKGRAYNLENRSRNCEEHEGGTSLEEGHQSAVEDLLHFGGCAMQSFEDKAQGLE